MTAQCSETVRKSSFGGKNSLSGFCKFEFSHDAYLSTNAVTTRGRGDPVEEPLEDSEPSGKPSFQRVFKDITVTPCVISLHAVYIVTSSKSVSFTNSEGVRVKHVYTKGKESVHAKTKHSFSELYAHNGEGI